MKIAKRSLPHRLLLLVFHFMFLVVPFIFTWINNELFEFNKMIALYGFAVVIFGLWGWRVLAEKKIVWKPHWFHWVALAFLGGQILSTLFSLHLPTSWWGYPSRLNGGLLSSVVFVFLYFALIQNLDKKQVTRLIVTNVFALALVSLYAIPEHFGVSPSCFLIAGEWNTACWKQDVTNRVFASFGQPNWLAAYVITVLPVSFWLARHTTKKSYRQLFLIIAGLALLTLWYTKSRSGLLGLAGGIGVSLAIVGWEKIRPSFTQTWKKLGLFVGGGILLAFLAWKYLVLPVATADQYEPGIYDLSKGSSSADIRTIVWHGAWKMWLRRPIVGSGPATFAYAYYADRPVSHNLVSEWDFLYNKAHNEFLNFLAETGLIGFTTYLVFILGSLWLLATEILEEKPELTSKKNQRERLLALTFINGLVALHLSNFFGFSTAMANLLLFSFPAMWLARKIQTKPHIKNVKFTQFFKKAVLIGIFTLVAFWLFLLGKAWRADFLNAHGKALFDSGMYSEALEFQQQAIRLAPFHPQYYETLANSYAELGLLYSLQEEPEAGAELAQAAIENIDYSLSLNPHHLNFWKTKTRVLLLTSPLLPENLSQAEKTLREALIKAPTDAKLWYNLGIALTEQDRTEEAIGILEKTTDLKPNYIKAQEQLGDLYQKSGELEKAQLQYEFILEELSSVETSVREKLKTLNNEK